ncbi:hypothetical protein OFB63_30045, partial [Escherichia coli]|nr:hypothetical protein [Escherichia coli]
MDQQRYENMLMHYTMIESDLLEELGFEDRNPNDTDTKSIIDAKKKKKKKGKLPKNYDPKVTPDPERWLPMR